MPNKTYINASHKSVKNINNIVLLITALLLLIANNTFADIYPSDNSKVNYRIIGFTFPVVKNATDFAVEIAGGMLMDGANFNGNITRSSNHTNKVVAEVQNFGSEYTWRALYYRNGVVIAKSDLYHFTVENSPLTDTNNTRLHVLSNSYKDQYYVLIEGALTIYDLKGNPVWYLPPSANAQGASEIKVSQDGTITMLMGAEANEIDYNGRLLWSAPKSVAPDDKSDVSFSFHHEFTKLGNGHYMALGNLAGKSEETMLENINYQQQLQKNGERVHFFKNPLHSQLYEFDSMGKLVWSWESTKYYEQSDIATLYRENFKKMAVHGHENAFYFDEKNSVIYLSFSTFNRIIKISYPSGEVLKTYGATYIAKGQPDVQLNNKKPEQALKNNFFTGQHSCKLTQNGELYLLNNNLNDTSGFPKIAIFKETKGGVLGGLEKVWEYECRIQEVTGRLDNSGGGCVSEMQNGDMFVLMNNPYNRALIVNRNKQLLWSAIPERKNENNDWNIISSYRSCIISRAQLENLIWKSYNQQQKASSKNNDISVTGNASKP